MLPRNAAVLITRLAQSAISEGSCRRCQPQSPTQSTADGSRSARAVQTRHRAKSVCGCERVRRDVLTARPSSPSPQRDDDRANGTDFLNSVPIPYPFRIPAKSPHADTKFKPPLDLRNRTMPSRILEPAAPLTATSAEYRNAVAKQRVFGSSGSTGVVPGRSASYCEFLHNPDMNCWVL
jgi:hypothetical protein